MRISGRISYRISLDPRSNSWRKIRKNFLRNLRTAFWRYLRIPRCLENTEKHFEKKNLNKKISRNLEMNFWRDLRNTFLRNLRRSYSRIPRRNIWGNSKRTIGHF